MVDLGKVQLGASSWPWSEATTYEPACHSLQSDPIPHRVFSLYMSVPIRQRVQVRLNHVLVINNLVLFVLRLTQNHAFHFVSCNLVRIVHRDGGTVLFPRQIQHGLKIHFLAGSDIQSNALHLKTRDDRDLWVQHVALNKSKIAAGIRVNVLRENGGMTQRVHTVFVDARVKAGKINVLDFLWLSSLLSLPAIWWH